MASAACPEKSVLIHRRGRRERGVQLEFMSLRHLSALCVTKAYLLVFSERIINVKDLLNEVVRVSRPPWSFYILKAISRRLKPATSDAG